MKLQSECFFCENQIKINDVIAIKAGSIHCDACGFAYDQEMKTIYISEIDGGHYLVPLEIDNTCPNCKRRFVELKFLHIFNQKLSATSEEK